MLENVPLSRPQIEELLWWAYTLGIVDNGLADFRQFAERVTHRLDAIFQE